MTAAKTAPKAKSKTSQLVKLEDEPMWIEACNLAEHIYGLLHLLPEEEKWNTTLKLRNSSNDLMYYVSQALSNTSPAAVEYDWAGVRKHASALKTMYRFAGKQKFIDLDPEIMVRLNKFLEQVDQKVMDAVDQTREANLAEVAHWRKKYEIWKGINS